MDVKPHPYGLLLPVFKRIAYQGVGMLRGWRAWQESVRATITVWPQQAIKIQRLLIPTAAAGDWLIHDIKLTPPRSEHAISQLAGGPIPAAAFGVGALDASFTTDAIAADTAISVTVEYIGDRREGAPFIASMICSLPNGEGRRVLPISSDGPIRPTKHEGARVAIQIDDRVWLLAEDRLGRRVLVRDATEQWTRLAESTDGGREHLVSCDGRRQTWADDRGPVYHPADASTPPVWPELDLDDSSPMPPPATSSVGVLHSTDNLAVSLHALEMPGPVLFGVDERTGKVVFEIGVRDPHGPSVFGDVFAEPSAGADERSAAWAESVNRVLQQGMYCEFQHDGYVPTWWKMAELLNRNLLDPADDLGAIGSAG